MPLAGDNTPCVCCMLLPLRIRSRILGMTGEMFSLSPVKSYLFLSISAKLPRLIVA